MKHFKTAMLIGIFLLFAAQHAFGMEWVGTNQSTISWDAVTDGQGGTPIPAADSVTYRVYLKTHPNGAETLQGETDTLQYTVTLANEGRYIVGVQTVRVPQNQPNELVSVINWSDSTDTVAVPNPFGFVYYEKPSQPKGLSQ